MYHEKKKYFAFICYKREDEEWAIWVQHELENYQLPGKLRKRTNFPSSFRPVFRDVDELKAGNLPQQIYSALENSENLIVICSPRAVQSQWVQKEISDYIEIGAKQGKDNLRRIFPFIVEGIPYASNKKEECLPPQLQNLQWTDYDIVCGNVKECGRDKAFIKIMAGLLDDVNFDDLWNRYEYEKAEEERRKREERERFLRMQSRFLAEKAIDIKHDSCLAQLLALEALPKDVSNPDRPYTIEAEYALRQATMHYCATFNGHTQDVNNLAFSYDGSLVASISNDFTIRIWSIETGLLCKIIETNHAFGHNVVFTHDNKRIITTFYDEALVVWDIESGNKLWDVNLPHLFSCNKRIMVHTMAVSNNDEKIALATMEGDVLIIDLKSEQTHLAEIGPVLSIAFNTKGDKLVTTSYDGLIVWDLVTGIQGTIKLKEGVEPKEALALFSPDDKYVAFAFENNLGIVGIGDNSPIQKLGESKVNYVALSYCDGWNSLSAISAEGEMTTWNLETFHPIFKSDIKVGNINYATYSANGQYVGVVTDAKTIIIQKTNYAHNVSTLVTQEEKLTSISYSRDGRQFITGGSSQEKYLLTIRDTESQNIVHRLSGHTDRFFSVLYSPDDKIIASASYDGTVRIWDAQTGNNIQTLDVDMVTNERTAFTSVDFCPDGKKIVAALYTGYIVIWDIIEGKVMHKFKHSSNPVWSVAYSPDGTMIVSASLDGDIKKWDAETGKLIRVAKGHTGSVGKCLFSSDGKYLMSSSDDGSVIIWNSKTLSIERILDKYSQEVILPNKKISVQQSKYNELINYASMLGLMSEQKNGILAMAYNFKDEQIIVSYLERKLIIWDIATGKIVLSLENFADEIESIAYCPTYSSYALASASGYVHTINIPSLQDLIIQTRNNLQGRELTEKEKVEYYLN